MVDKIDPSVAAGLYKMAQGVSKGQASGNQDKVEFGALIKEAATESLDVLRAGEKASAEAVIGTADLTDVVEAISSAEMTLQTVVAVRDRMLSAYQEIMRMPI